MKEGRAIFLEFFAIALHFKRPKKNRISINFENDQFELVIFKIDWNSILFRSLEMQSNGKKFQKYCSTLYNAQTKRAVTVLGANFESKKWKKKFAESKSCKICECDNECNN
jgi:hypothetical protein